MLLYGIYSTMAKNGKLKILHTTT